MDLVELYIHLVIPSVGVPIVTVDRHVGLLEDYVKGIREVQRYDLLSVQIEGP